MQLTSKVNGNQAPNRITQSLGSSAVSRSRLPTAPTSLMHRRIASTHCSCCHRTHGTGIQVNILVIGSTSMIKPIRIHCCVILERVQRPTIAATRRPTGRRCILLCSRSCPSRIRRRARPRPLSTRDTTTTRAAPSSHADATAGHARRRRRR